MMETADQPHESVADRYREEGMYQKYSPNHEASYSGLLSCIFHFLMFFLIPLLATAFENPPPAEVAMDIIAVVDPDNQLSAGEGASDPTDSDVANAEEIGGTPEESPIDLPDVTELTEIEQPKVRDTIAEIDAETAEYLAEAGFTAKEAASRAASAKQALSDNIGSQPSGGASGSGRAARAARWVLTLTYSSAQQELQVLGGLGAELAFPLQGDQWQYFTNLASGPKGEVRTLAGESRIYWIFENSFQHVARHLGVKNATMMAAFLPVELEQRMVRLEQQENGAKEEDIRQTVFKATQRGGKWDVIVSKQILYK